MGHLTIIIIIIIIIICGFRSSFWPSDLNLSTHGKHMTFDWHKNPEIAIQQDNTDQE
jgi:hypothetical protein